MKVVIIDYNAGNIKSVEFALNRLGIQPLLTNNSDELLSADKIIFPGVGEASTAMNFLKHLKLDEQIKELKQPVLGICLGMQLMCSYSEEGSTECLGIFPQKVKRFNSTEFKVPQIGWNQILNLNNPLFSGLTPESYVYYVHGFYAELGLSTIAETNYILNYSAALNKGNFYGVQFHPEKSGSIGEIILKNFIDRI
jgi:glutamine amidotransferase